MHSTSNIRSIPHRIWLFRNLIKTSNHFPRFNPTVTPPPLQLRWNSPSGESSRRRQQPERSLKVLATSLFDRRRWPTTPGAVARRQRTNNARIGPNRSRRQPSDDDAAAAGCKHRTYRAGIMAANNLSILLPDKPETGGCWWQENMWAHLSRKCISGWWCEAKTGAREWAHSMASPPPLGWEIRNVCGGSCKPFRFGNHIWSLLSLDRRMQG